MNEEYLDLNDLPRFDTPTEINPEADAFEKFRPIPDGVWNCVLDYAESDPQKRWTRRYDKNGDAYYSTSVVATVTSGDYADRKVADRFVSTMVFRGTSRVAGIVKAARGADVLRGIRSHEQLVTALDEIIVGHEPVRIQTAWDARYPTGDKDALGRDVYKRFLHGMKRFPQTPEGEYEHTVKSPADGSEITARAEIEAYLPPSADNPPW
jgi:hypothetical protein